MKLQGFFFFMFIKQEVGQKVVQRLYLGRLNSTLDRRQGKAGVIWSFNLFNFELLHSVDKPERCGKCLRNSLITPPQRWPNWMKNRRKRAVRYGFISFVFLDIEIKEVKNLSYIRFWDVRVCSLCKRQLNDMIFFLKMIETVQLTYIKHLQGVEMFLKGRQNYLGVSAEVGLAKILWLQKGSRR